MTIDPADLLFVVGLLFMAIGVWLWHAPAAWIIVGSALVFAALVAVLPPRGGVRDDS